MSMYELHDVTLNEVEGRGYAFKQSTAFGKARRGIFYPDNEEDLEKLQDRDAFTFTGPCYYGERGPRPRSFDVAVVKITATRMGDRVDFEALDNPDPVRRTDVALAEA